MTCAVCGEPVGPLELDAHVDIEHPEVRQAYEVWAGERRAALLVARMSRFLGMLRMRGIRVQPVDDDYRPVGDGLVVRLDMASGWGWCPLCRRAWQRFDFIGHFGFTGRHPELFGPQVNGFDVEVLPEPFLGA